MNRWLTIRQAAAAYPGVFTERLLKRLAEERRVPFSYAGRQRVFRADDLEGYLESNRVEPPRGALNKVDRPTSPNDEGRPHRTGFATGSDRPSARTDRAQRT